MNLKSNQNQLDKIIQLINWFIAEINFNKNSLKNIIQNCFDQKTFSDLTFLKMVLIKMKKMPFPEAWENSIENWPCFLNYDDKKLLSSLSSILGAFDSTNQIVALKHINSKFEESLKNAKIKFKSQSKLSKSLGILTGLAIYTVLI